MPGKRPLFTVLHFPHPQMGRSSPSLLIVFIDCRVLSREARGCSLLPISTSPAPTSFLSSFFTWKKVRWLWAAFQGCPVHKDGDVTSIAELGRQGDKFTESLHLPPHLPSTPGLNELCPGTSHPDAAHPGLGVGPLMGSSREAPSP